MGQKHCQPPSASTGKGVPSAGLGERAVMGSLLAIKKAIVDLERRLAQVFEA